MKLEDSEVKNIVEQLWERLLPMLAGVAAGDSALMSCTQAGNRMGCSGDKVRALVEAGLIDRVPGFSEIRISPEALAKYRNTAAPK